MTTDDAAGPPLDRDTALMLAHARLTTRRDVLTCHAGRLRLALGCDRARLSRALAWASRGRPDAVYVNTDDARTRALFETLYPGLVPVWTRIAEKDPHRHDDPGDAQA